MCTPSTSGGCSDPPPPTPHGFMVGNRDDGVSPLQATAWAGALQGHPDPEFTEAIVQGLKDGFWIGFNRASPLVPVDRNMPSAAEHDDVVSDYIDAELRKKRLLCPYSIEEFARGGKLIELVLSPKATPPGNGE